MNKKILIALVLIIMVIAGGTYFWYQYKANKKIEQPQTTAEYTNNQYGFSISLPLSWKGYSVITKTWEGLSVGALGEIPFTSGPQILIRHPLWSEQNPRQDIPVMIFTLKQWGELQQEQFHIGAAPIPPSMLGYNSEYVFALPARYNYAFLDGWQEVDEIVRGNSLKPLSSWGSPSGDGKILICGGIPNGSTQNIKETSRLFINLPKDTYPDKDHNLQFKTVSGNATAGWVSNAGAYGEAFQSNSNCWSYYYEFDGTGEVDLTVKNVNQGMPDYFVKFLINSGK